MLLVDRWRTFKALLTATSALGFAALFSACSSTSDGGVDDDASVADGDGGLVGMSDAGLEDAKVPWDGSSSAPDGRLTSDVDGGIVCQKRCEAAGCADLEACEIECAKQDAAIPAACRPAVSALEACVEAHGTWTCEAGKAVASADACTDDANTVLNCLLMGAFDAGASDAQADAP